MSEKWDTRSEKWSTDDLQSEREEFPRGSTARATLILASVLLQVGEDLTGQLRELNANIEHDALRSTKHP